MAITFTAGQRLTAGSLNAFVPMYVVQGTDQDSTTTTLANHNTFASLAFEASQVWVCKLYVDTAQITASSNLAFNMNWTVTGGLAQARRWCLGAGPTNTAGSGSVTPVNMACRQGSGSVTYGTVQSVTNRMQAQEEFVVTTTTAGTLTFQWAQQGTASGTIRMYAGSFFTAYRVS